MAQKFMCAHVDDSPAADIGALQLALHHGLSITVTMGINTQDLYVMPCEGEIGEDAARCCITVEQ
jgi:hypothetical protein